MDDALLDIKDKPARQQPEWGDAARVRQVTDTLARHPALVDAADVDTLRSLLARVASGEALVVQSGDCAEDPAECTTGYVARKTAVLDLLAGALKMITHKPVIRVGRIAGQFGKPAPARPKWSAAWNCRPTGATWSTVLSPTRRAGARSPAACWTATRRPARS